MALNALKHGLNNCKAKRADIAILLFFSAQVLIRSNLYFQNFCKIIGFAIFYKTYCHIIRFKLQLLSSELFAQDTGENSSIAVVYIRVR